MELTYYGLSCFRIKSGSACLVTDPFNIRGLGISIPNLEADMVLYTGDPEKLGDCSSKLKTSEARAQSGQSYFEVAEPGEYEVGGIFVRVYSDSSVSVITSENVNVCYLGMISGHAPSIDEIEDVGNIDYLIVPVGNGVSFIDWKNLDKVIKDIDPAVVIPSCYKLDGLKGDFSDLKKAEEFLNEFGFGAVEPEKKLSLVPVSRNEDYQMKAVVLEKRG
ncbi:MBL fold metallo-hydrolase [Candidatus Dojkabacteria bacterium]|nr:MBL fold metallo-hydrolase [Candidatus Dojkabacteria bacterium]